MASPSHLKLAGVPRSLIHIQEHLQAIQVQIYHILRLSTSFVSVSAKISSLESVRARCCVLWLVLEWTNKYFGAPAPWSIWWLADMSSTLRLGVEQWRQPCTGDVKTPSPLWASFLVESEIKVTVIVFTEETWLPWSNTLRECFNNVDLVVPLWLTEPRDKSSCREFASTHPLFIFPHFIFAICVSLHF